MKRLIKEHGRDFVILNLSDPQLSNKEWGEGEKARSILEYTVKELMERVKPDLVTVSGDIAWAGADHSYDMFAAMLERYGVPWAPVWGNHDEQGGLELTDAVAAVLTDELTTIADITAKVDGGEDVTIHKVTNRLTRLVSAGVAVKEQISVPTADGKTRKVMAYKVAD